MATPPPAQETVSQPHSVARKPIHSLILDTGPLIKNDPSVSALLSQAEKLYTVPSVIPEIKDRDTRTRVETTLLPFVTIRAPGPGSIKFVTEFARRTGDLAVLSRPDIEIIALGYEIECERNNGDWRLRNTPGQKGLNGRPTRPDDDERADQSSEVERTVQDGEQPAATPEMAASSDEPKPNLDGKMAGLTLADETTTAESLQAGTPTEEIQTVAGETQAASLQSPINDTTTAAAAAEESDSDSDGWITPSNLKKHQDQDASGSTPSQPLQKTLQVAILTSDYAMQNVALRINLNLITPAFSRITYLKNWILRCHGCFSLTKDMDKQFCPKCGQPTLTRASCSTDQHGRFQIHLKKNFQWNNRGNVYSVPKAVHGSANGRRTAGAGGGGKNGWGQDLILAEDQKEYLRATDEQKRQRRKDLMDEDYLPAILSGRRQGQAGKIRVGAGRNVNAKRKH
ncbi:D-site 20S pre-rRNA nuclease [Moelleriella libera RCEF 2490]|uniref:20S-pre-rRNA D-site endonuclease NOB1 n=1 Tax=Moelleriella libera RCEF 2490 TaxID=1081109 RepID=A0A167ZLY9_9HYPO|nr:D-site 20S pre-rRNA nuclease [Moelleriella libera RCEF 2490]